MIDPRLAPILVGVTAFWVLILHLSWGLPWLTAVRWLCTGWGAIGLAQSIYSILEPLLPWTLAFQKWRNKGRA
jgi:hypothetical protein